MSKNAETKNAVVAANARVAELEHLIEGHWRPEVERLRAEVERLTPRRAETAEELDALPDRTVIRDADEWVFEKLNYSNDGTGESFWAAPAIDPDSSDADGLEVVLPATVLWLPEVSS